MKLCAAIPCFFRGDPCDAIRTVAALGYRAVETYDWRGMDLKRVRDTLDSTGVEMVSICTTEFRLTDPTYRTAFLDGVRRSCEAAQRLGARKMITQVGNDTGAPREAQRESIEEGLAAACPILGESGVTLMIEPLNTLVNHPGYYLTSSAEAFGIVRNVGNERVRVVFDLYHQQVSEGNLVPNLLSGLDCVAHLHAAGHPGRIELDRGETDYRFVFDAVTKAGYRGFCGLEYAPTVPAEESLARMMRLYGDI